MCYNSRMTNSTLAPERTVNRIPVRSIAKVKRLSAQGVSLRVLAEQYNTTVWQVRRALATV